MWVSDQQILKAVRAGLKRLGGDLGGSSAHLLSAIDLAVSELAARADGRAGSVLASWREARQLAERGVALATTIGIDRFASRLQGLSEPAAADLAALDISYGAVRQLLVDCVLALNTAVSNGQADAVWRAAAQAFFLDLARHDAGRAAQDLAAPAVDVGAEQQAPVEDELRRYLATSKGSAQLPGPFDLINLKLLAGGFSRQTMLAQVRDAQGRERALVVRKQVPGGFLDGACNTLAEERPFFHLAHQYRLPVPELYWHERDASIIGGEFFVTECMPGTTIGSSYQMAEGIGDAFLKQLAEMMAQLHCIDWSPHADELRALSRIPAAAPADSAQAALAMVGQFEDYWRAANLAPLPTMELMVDWLKRNVPRTQRQAVLCHGDIGFHNLLVQDGRITALLDWETSRLADPARDLSYFRPMVTHYIEWDRFMAWYRAAGGPEIEQASLDYYAVFGAFAHVIVCEVAMGNSFPLSDRPELEYLRLGLPVRAYFFKELLDTCGPVWGGNAAA